MSSAWLLRAVRIFVTQKRTRLGRRRKSSVAHCRGSQRPQRRTCESAVMGIMQNYGRAARETRGDTWGLSNRRVRLGRMSSRRGPRGKDQGLAFRTRRERDDVECFPPRGPRSPDNRNYRPEMDARRVAYAFQTFSTVLCATYVPSLRPREITKWYS